jgi:hypothetical protein
MILCCILFGCLFSVRDISESEPITIIKLKWETGLFRREKNTVFGISSSYRHQLNKIVSPHMIAEIDFNFQ